MNSYPSLLQAALRFPYGSDVSFSPPWFSPPRAFRAVAGAPRGNCPADSFSPGTKLNLSTKEVEAALGSKRLFQRLKHAGWIKALFQSRDALYPVSRILAVQRRLEAGDVPPLLPSEIKQRAQAH